MILRWMEYDKILPEKPWLFWKLIGHEAVLLPMPTCSDIFLLFEQYKKYHCCNDIVEINIMHNR